MEQAFLVARQVFLIFIYIGIGMVCARKGVLDEKTGRSLSSFALGVITPVVIMRNYARPMDRQSLQGMGLAFLLAVVFHVLATVVAVSVVKKREDEEHRIERLGLIYSNCGYMAIPLISVTAGETGVFYAMAYICIFNICLWSLGMMVLSGERKMNVKKALLNPGTAGVAVGMLLYFTQLQMPSILLEAMDSIVAFNTPLPMLTTGIFLEKLNVRKTFTNLRIYYISLLRLVAFPAGMLLLMKLLGVANWIPGGHNVVLTIGLGCACPCAATITLLPVRFGMKGEYGAELIAVSTLLSIITLPAVTLAINTWF